MVESPPYWLVMPAAGRGRRMGESGLPKQYLPLAGRSVIEHALAPFLGDARCLGIVVVLAADDRHFRTLPVAAAARLCCVTGGAERCDSVVAGLAELARRPAARGGWVLVHDAARPCLARGDLEALLASLADAPAGALLATRLADTLKRADAAGNVATTVPREALWRAATPQAFRLERLIAALAAGGEATDEASAVEALGDQPRLVAGSAGNVKITDAADLELARRILGTGAQMGEQRVGFGLDVHAFGPGDHVWLGGCRIEHSHGLIAHSDGDVLLHALCDALLGAAGLGDIGQHFPDSDPRWRGVASSELLAQVLASVAAAGYRVVNADLTLIGEAPRVAPHRDAIRDRIATLMGLGRDRVNLKATTTERLGFLGRREGLAAEAAVLIERAA